MNERLKKITDPIKTFWGGLSMRVRIIIIAVILAVLILALALTMTLNKTEYVTIYSDLSETETSEILKALSDQEIEVRVVDGNAIQVPAEQESTVRMSLATAGYPKSGLSYYLIEENSSMLTTDYERRQYETLQLQERLGASIETLEGVKQAIVTLAQPEESVFYLTEKTEPTASVVVHMKTGQELKEEQVEGIRNLVASAVKGLTTNNVSITDGHGNSLTSDESSAADAKRTRLAAEVESAIKKKVEHVLEGPYGEEHFKVSVAATIDTDNLVREEMNYYPSDPQNNGNNTGVVNEETHATDNYSSNSGDGGVPGTSTNADVTEYPTGDGNSQTSSDSTSDNIKYDVSYVKTLLEKNGAYISALSIGVVVDKNSFDPGERENLTNLVAGASGIPRESITVESFKFYEEPTEPEIEEGGLGMMTYIIIGVLAALLLAAVIASILIRRRRKKLEAEALAEAERLEQERLATEAFGEEVDTEEPLGPIERIDNALVGEIKDFTINNPEVAAQMIKQWLRADEER